MAKRFTDTDKWKREWFYDLKPHAKLVWLYLLDQVDHCGIWPRNFRLMSEQVGVKVDHEQLMAWFGSKIIQFEEDKYWIPSFFDFQYGSSKDGFKAKASALATLRQLGLIDSEGNPVKSTEHFGTLPNTSEQSMDCPSIGIGIGTSKSIGICINEGSVEKTEPVDQYSAAFDEFWKAYPRKADKSVALKAFKKNVVLPGELQDLLKATSRFAAVMAREKRESKHIRLPATFLNDRKWRDALEADFTEASAKNYQNERDTDHDAEIEKLWGAG